MKNNDVEVHAYPIERCGVGRAQGAACGRQASHVHVRSDTTPPLVLWMCPGCHAAAVRESNERKAARKRGRP